MILVWLGACTGADSPGVEISYTEPLPTIGDTVSSSDGWVASGDGTALPEDGAAEDAEGAETALEPDGEGSGSISDTTSDTETDSFSDATSQGGGDDAEAPQDSEGGDDSQVESDGEGGEGSEPDAGGEGGEGGEPVPVDPMDPGPFGVIQSSATIGESGGGGLFGSGGVDLQLFYPTADGQYPVVIFLHGFNLGPDNYTSYGEHLASWGYVAILPQLPGDLAQQSTHTELKDIVRDMLDWVGDASWELDGKANPSLIGLAGHSMGGKVSLLVATEDDRVLAIGGVDPVDSQPPFTFNPSEYPSVTPELMDQIGVPLLLIGETLDAQGVIPGQSCAPADDNFQQYFQHAAAPALEVDMKGAAHMSFLDNPNCGFSCSACQVATADTTEIRKITQRLLVAFFNQRLLGDETAAYWLTGEGMDALEASGTVTTQSANGF